MILTEEIFQETYIVRRLKIKESVKSFDCGDTDLNDFILNESLLYRKALLAVSYVVAVSYTHLTLPTKLEV